MQVQEPAVANVGNLDPDRRHTVVAFAVHRSNTGRESVSRTEKPEARHRLAAILAADAVGYSRLMSEDERATLAALDTARKVFSSQIESQGGRVVDTAGDSVLASFETATGAVSAALAIQRKPPPEPPKPWPIGAAACHRSDRRGSGREAP